MTTAKALFTTLAALALAAAATAQDLLPAAAPQDRPILITGATVHPVSSEPIEGGAVFFEGGEIRAVMTAGEADRWRRTAERPVNLRVIDAEGLHVYPGLIGANTVTGLMEVSAVDVTVDVSESGAITPEVRAAVAVNPDTTIIPVTRRAGILTVGVMPAGGAIPGRASVIRMNGWTWEDLAVEPEAGLIVNWPNLRPIDAWWMSQSVEEQKKEAQENRRRIVDAFDAARAYFDARAADPGSVSLDLRYEAMRAAIEADRPVFVRAQELEQIQDAVTFFTDRAMRPVVVGGRDAHLTTELLARRDVPVIITGTHRTPRRRDSAYDEPFTLPKKLQDAGVPWAMATSGGTFQTPHERNLPHHAGTAVAYGLDPDAALRAITLSPAEILGVADRLGSIEPGKAATLIVTDGDPLELTTDVVMAYIDGARVDLRSKQTELYEKYREKYRQRGLIND